MTVGLFGFGRINQAVLRLALLRPWLQVRTIIVRSAEKEGWPARRVVEDAPVDLLLTTDAEGTLGDVRPDVVIIATRSRLSDVGPQLALAAAAGADVVCTAEELAYIRPEDGLEARAIHQLAKEHGVAILAAGVNPGFVLDLWPLVLSGLAWDVPRLTARRIVDVSVFGPLVRQGLGINYTAEAFQAGLDEGRIAGHLGFRESLRLIAAGMGTQLDDIEITTEPMFTDETIELADGRVEAGRSAGANQRAVGLIDGQPWIDISLTLHVAPARAGLEPVDEVRVEGRHELNVRVSPGAGAIASTAAQLVNSVPRVIAAPVGVHFPGSLPAAAPWLAAEPPPASRRTS